jgi:hypothetical protein
MSRKIQIVLPEPVALQLQELADSRGEPLATFARQLVRDGVALAAKEGRVAASAASAGNPGSRGGRPRWLEPYGGDPAWRQEMWGAVVALHGRYPRHLEHLHTGWWSDESQAETLYALARTPAKSSLSTISSTRTPTSSASRGAALKRRGTLVRHRRIGPGVSLDACAQSERLRVRPALVVRLPSASRAKETGWTR